MILIVDAGKHYDSEQGRVFRVVVEEQWQDDKHGPQWVQPPADELPWWLAQCILEDAREQLTGSKR